MTARKLRRSRSSTLRRASQPGARKAKAVRCWAVVNKTTPYLYALWTFDDQRIEWRASGPAFNPKYDKWVRVEIRPLAQKRRRRAK